MPIKNKIKLNLSVTEEDIYRRGSWKGEGRRKSVEPRAPRRPRLNIYPHVLHEGCHVTVFEMTRRDEGHAIRDTLYPSSFVLLLLLLFFFAFYPQRQGWFYEHERIYRRNERECRQLVKPNEKLGGEPPIIRPRFSEKSKYMQS